MVEKLLKLATPQDPIQELVKRRDTASQEELAASQKVTELETKKAQNEAERAATQAKAKETATTELTARQTEREKPIKEEKGGIDKQLMDAHFEPSKENLESQVALFALINVIGFAIGAGGKQNAQQAMSAMNGMLEGHQKGREDVFKQEKVKFDSNFKALQSKATFLENELRHSLEEFTRDKRAADERAAAAFAEAGADFMKTYAEKNGLVATYERAKEVLRAADKAVADEQRRQERIQDKIDAETRAEAQRIIDEKRRLAERIDFTKAVKGMGVAKETPQEKREAKMGTAGPARTIYDQTGKMLPDEKTAKEVQASAQGIRAIESLQQDLRDKEVRTGLTAKAASLLEQISSLGSSDFETAVNSKLTGTDKTTLFLKKALLTSYAIERAAAGGARLTVQMMKQAGPVLDPTNYTPETYNELLDSRRRELYETLHDYGFGAEDVRKMTSRQAYTPYGGQADSAPALTGAAAIPTGKSVSVDEERSRAKAAIAAGKDSDAVKARFKEKTGQEL